MNCLHENPEMIRIDVRRDAMAEVENVARAFAIAGERICNTLPNDFR